MISKDITLNYDPFISADYHLLKEIRHGKNDISRTIDIIKMHNSIVKPSDCFLFLGDISESEIFDRDSLIVKRELIKLCNQLNGNKIILRGNNDTGDDELYYKMGFKKIINKESAIKDNIIFSHKPVEVKDDKMLNVHGHIHGSREYWNIDYKNHIDAYFGLYGRPMKLSELITYYNENKYTGCFTVNKEEN